MNSNAKRNRGKILKLCLIALLVTPAIGHVSAQEMPSHLQVSGTPGTLLDISAHLPQFESLEAYSSDVIRDISARNFTSANATLVRYNAVANQLKAFNATSPDQIKMLDAVKASQTDLNQLASESELFNQLYERESPLATSSPFSDESVNNTLTMQRLLTDLGSIKGDLDRRIGDINDVTVQYGLDLKKKYGDTSGSFDTYMAVSARQLRNVTDLVFRNTTTSAAMSTAAGQYGDSINFSGKVSADGEGVSGGVVDVLVDNNTVAKVSINETGYYNYTYTIDGISAGTHVAIARYTPQGVAYKNSKSAAVDFSVLKVPVINTMEVGSGSLSLLNQIRFDGYVQTDKGPVKNASVVLYANDKAQGVAKTDENGSYYIGYSMSLPEFLASLLTSQPRTFHTTLEPGDRPLDSAQSEALAVPVFGTVMAATTGSVAWGYLILAAVVLFVAAPPLYVIRRRKAAYREPKRLFPEPTAEPSVAHEAPPAAAPSAAALPEEFVSEPELGAVTEQGRVSIGELIGPEHPYEATAEPSVAHEAPPAAAPSVVSAPAPELAPGGAAVPAFDVDVPSTIRKAQDLFDAGGGERAIILLYDAMLSLLVGRGVVLTASMTNWEKCLAIEKAVPDVRRPARVLTYADELARYSGKPVVRRTLDTATKAFELIGARNDAEGVAGR